MSLSTNALSHWDHCSWCWYGTGAGTICSGNLNLSLFFRFIGPNCFSLLQVATNRHRKHHVNALVTFPISPTHLYLPTISLPSNSPRVCIVLSFKLWPSATTDHCRCCSVFTLLDSLPLFNNNSNFGLATTWDSKWGSLVRGVVGVFRVT